MNRCIVKGISETHCRLDDSALGVLGQIGKVLVLGSLLLWAGCSRGSEPKTSAANFSTGGEEAAQITAAPNPVPAGSEKGKTLITWSAGAGHTGEVYLVTRDGTEKLFSGHAPKGRQEAAFITADRDFEFRLYEGKDHSKILASVKVTREKNSP